MTGLVVLAAFLLVVDFALWLALWDETHGEPLGTQVPAGRWGGYDHDELFADEAWWRRSG